MKFALVLFLVVVTIVVAYLVWVRIAPTKPADWLISPAEAPSPKAAGQRRRGDNAPVFDASPDDVMAALATIAEDKPRTTLVVRSDDGRQATYQVRTKWLGFPDVMIFEAVPRSDGGTRLEYLARSRFAGYDWGVNAARVEEWLEDLGAALR